MPRITTQVAPKIAPAVSKAQLAFLSATFYFKKYAIKDHLVH